MKGLMCLSLCAAFVLLPVGVWSDSGLDDSTPPQLVEFSLDPTEVDVSEGPADVTVTMRVTDDYSGVGFVAFFFYGPSRQWIEVRPYPVSGTPNDRIYQGTATFQQYAEDGTWQVDNLRMDDIAGNRVWLGTATLQGMGFPTDVQVSSQIEAAVDLDPNTLNLKSRGKFVTCYIELPEGYDVADIDVGTVVLNEVVRAEPWPIEMGDHDLDDIADLMVKFSRPAVEETLPTGQKVEVRVEGEVGEQMFSGADTIRVLPPKVVWPNGGEVLQIGTEYQLVWGHPEGCVPESYRVYYTQDDGDNWNAVVRNIVDTSYAWPVPDIASGSCRLLVEAHDSLGLMGYDLSDEDFSICVGAGVRAEDLIPTRFALHSARPNPSTGGAVIRFDLPEPCLVRVTIHDVRGHLVKKLVDEARSANSYSELWDAKDSSGRQVSGGIYFASLEAGEYSATTKILLVR